MRGKRIGKKTAPPVTRITPAHAGKTRWRGTPPRASTDHPRACGENPENFDSTTALSGSPPRMRGKRLFYRPHRGGARITPAHAGKTRANCPDTSQNPDHPRACGENGEKPVRIFEAHGSPPRMRGKPGFRLVEIALERITPAHAGKTCAVRKEIDK